MPVTWQASSTSISAIASSSGSRRGYNFFLIQVENALAEHPAVNEVSVVGLPIWAEILKATPAKP